MKKVQLDRFDMVLSVESYLTKNKALFSDNKPLLLTVNLLSSKIGELKTQLAIQLINNKGIAIDKKNSRKALENKAFLLASACRAYAAVASDSDFYGRCQYTRSDLVHLRDNELTGVCVTLKQEIVSRATALLQYGVTDAKITDFESAIKHFLNLIDEPKTAITERAQATRKIAILLSEISGIIRLRLDNMIHSMEESQPAFVSVYKNTRSIKNTAVRKRSLTIVVEDADTSKPIPNAISEPAKGMLRKSGKKGMNFIQNLDKGRHELRISHADYEPTILKYIVQPGETTKLRVLLKKKVDG